MLRLKQLREADKIQLTLEVLQEFVEPHIHDYQLKKIKNIICEKYNIIKETNDDIRLVTTLIFSGSGGSGYSSTALALTEKDSVVGITVTSKGNGYK